jgi:hypothetical protein
VKRLAREDITLAGFVKEKFTSFERARKEDLHKERPRSVNVTSHRDVLIGSEVGDEEDVDDGPSASTSKSRVVGRFRTKDRHCSRFIYNLLCYVPYIDEEVLNDSSIRTPLTWSNLVWASVYRISFFAIWVWLQIITGMCVSIKLFFFKEKT